MALIQERLHVHHDKQQESPATCRCLEFEEALAPGDVGQRPGDAAQGQRTGDQGPQLQPHFPCLPCRQRHLHLLCL